MFNNIINKLYLKYKYNGIINKIFSKYKINIALNFLNDTINNENYLIKDIELYKFTIKLFDEFIKDKYGFHILNVNLKFDYNTLINNILKSNLYVTQKIKINKNFKLNSLIFNDKVLIIVDTLNNFININKNKYIRKYLTKRLPNYKINFILFVYENLYTTINKIANKKVNNIIFIDCLQKFIANWFYDHTNIKYLILIKFLKLKNLKIVNPIINNNFNYIYNIYSNINKINFDQYSRINIEKHLKSKLFNQNEVIKSVLDYTNGLKIKKNYDKKPIGSWLLCGPSGTGKTELARILTYSIFNSYDNLIKIDMSEYMESHSISKLIGSPPGYIGYDEDTILSKRFKYNSSFVVLFDEIEKAHKDISNLMLQILDEGRITLSNNTFLNFNKSFIIFTSNLGYSNKDKHEKINKQLVLNEINKFFRIEFLNRLNNIIIFNPITMKSYINIFNKFIQEFSFKFLFYINFNYNLKNDLIKYSYNKMYGSRPLKRNNENIYYKVYYHKINSINKRNYLLNYLNNFNNCYLNIKFYPVLCR